MLAVLDTDHFSATDRSADFARTIQRKCAEFEGEVFITVVTIQEVMQGWLGLLASKKNPADEIPVYQRLARSVDALSRWDALPWDTEAVSHFESLKRKRIRIGTKDLKIAAIAIAHDALLLTRNLSDFRQVPGLRVENWLD